MRAVILAAGKGKRLMSEEANMPKVLRKAAGKSLIEYVLVNTSFIAPEDTCIVTGYKKEMVKETVGNSYNFADQDEQLGTGHAVMMAADWLKDYYGDVLVAYGDMPLLKKETYINMMEEHKNSNVDATILTASVENPPDYGRIIRDAEGKLVDIVEKKDCTPAQLNINEINVGVYVFRAQPLLQALEKLDNRNAQKEYYLTDVPKILLKDNRKVSAYTIRDINQIFGVNTLEDLEFCESILQKEGE